MKWSLEIHLHKNETGHILHHRQGEVNAVFKMLRIFEENSGQFFDGLRIRKNDTKSRNPPKKMKRKKQYKTIKKRIEKYFPSLTDIIS